MSATVADRGVHAAAIGDHLLPEGWEVTTVGDLFDIQQGKALSAAARQGPDQHPFLRTANVLWETVDVTSLDHMAFTQAERDRLTLQANDLLVCEGGDIGRTALWRDEVEGCYYQNHLHRLRARRADILPAFFCYWMQAAWTVFGLYAGAGNRTTIPNLSRARLAALEVALAPLDEQERIVRALSAIRAHGASARRHVNALIRVRGAAADHLFGSGDAERWPQVPLGDVVPVRQYGLSVRGSARGSWPMLRMTNLRGGRVVDDALQFVDVSPDVAYRWEVHPGDLLFNRTNSADLVGRVGIVRELGQRCLFASYLIRLTPDPSALDAEFLNSYLNWEPVQRTLRGMATRGVSQANISASTLATLPIQTPPLAEQRTIASTLNVIDTAIVAHQRIVARSDAVFACALRDFFGGAP